MKWFKHISDSLDDPFIFALMDEFGAEGYLVFFGIIEIYAREFKTEDGWKLSEKSSYFRHKLRISSRKIEKILSKIWKWEVEYDGNQVIIFIPKFKELMDEWSLRKLGSSSGVTPKILKTELDKELDKDKDIIPPTPRKRVVVYSDDFQSFWKEYPKKVSRDAAWKAWQKRNGDRPPINDILKAIREQKLSDKWTKDGGSYIPNPSTWINGGSWADEVRGSIGMKPMVFEKKTYVCQKCDQKVFEVVEHRGQMVCEDCLRVLAPEIPDKMREILKSIVK